MKRANVPCGCCGWGILDQSTHMDLCTECFREDLVQWDPDARQWVFLDKDGNAMCREQVEAIQMLKRLAS